MVADVRDFLLPDLGEGLEEAEVVEWQVAVGDRVELNQVIVVVETAKASVEVPSPFAGTVVELMSQAGDSIEVGKPLIRIEVAPESGQEGAGEAENNPQPLVGYGESKAAEATSKRRRRIGRPGSEDGPTLQGPVLAKPPVRKLARDLGVDLSAIAPGSGPRAAITRDDVLSAAKSASGSFASAEKLEAAGLVTTGMDKAVPGFRGRRPGDVEPIRGVRKRIGDKMVSSRRDIPHAGGALDADCTRLWELSADLSEHARAEGVEIKLTPFALVLRATVLALRRFPMLNATINPERREIRYLEPINLGFASDTDRGLVVPVIRDAHTRSTLELALELNRLAIVARQGQITPDDLTGGTFTVTNYGAFGSDDGDPVINAPEAAILGVGSMRERPWVVNGEIQVRRVVRLRLAFDHRICDGGEGGRFLAYLAALVEEPARILLRS